MGAKKKVFQNYTIHTIGPILKVFYLSRLNSKKIYPGAPRGPNSEEQKNQKNPKKYFETFGSTLGSIGLLIGPIKNKQVDFPSFFPQKLKKAVFYRSFHV
jgi:hypothetical protein